MIERQIHGGREREEGDEEGIDRAKNHRKGKRLTTGLIKQGRDSAGTRNG
jgi:hypothetical protein